MALASGVFYTHREHLAALEEQLSLDPLQPAERGALIAASNGAEPRETRLAWRAQIRLSAPTRPSAFYSLLAVCGEADPRRLTDREVQAIRLLASGATSDEIGERLGYRTEASQHNHGGEILRTIRDKLGVGNNVELIRAAYRVRLIEPMAGDPALPPWSP